jgi:hypothetical protein
MICLRIGSIILSFQILVPSYVLSLDFDLDQFGLITLYFSGADWAVQAIAAGATLVVTAAKKADEASQGDKSGALEILGGGVVDQCRTFTHMGEPRRAKWNQKVQKVWSVRRGKNEAARAEALRSSQPPTPKEIREEEELKSLN